EEGIRDWSVTGVQTCALPIYGKAADQVNAARATRRVFTEGPIDRGQAIQAGLELLFDGIAVALRQIVIPVSGRTAEQLFGSLVEIGRASCRERVESWGGAGGL